MARLIPVAGDAHHFAAVDDNGRTLAVGNIEVDLIPGAQRHGSLQFIVSPDSVSADPLREAVEQQARLGS